MYLFPDCHVVSFGVYVEDFDTDAAATFHAVC